MKKVIFGADAKELNSENQEVIFESLLCCGQSYLSSGHEKENNLLKKNTDKQASNSQYFLTPIGLLEGFHMVSCHSKTKSKSPKEKFPLICTHCFP